MSVKLQTNVPDRDAERVRELADRSGLSVSATASLLLRSALNGNDGLVSALSASGDKRD